LFPEATTAIIVTAKIIEAPYSHPYLNPWVAIPKVKDNKAAAHKICIVLSSKFYITISHNVFGGFTIGALVPYCTDLQFISLESPVIPFYRFDLRSLNKPGYPPIESSHWILYPSFI